MASTTEASSTDEKKTEPDAAFSEFYTEVKQIEQRDAVLTSKQQIDRLNRAGSTYFNLNPFDVLQVDPDTALADVKKKYRQMSILVHPDKNLENAERAQKAFEAVNKAFKTLENEEGYKRCQEIIEEAKVRTEEMIKQKRKQLKKEGKPTIVPEDEPDKYKHAVYVQTCKLFADLERLRQERETKDMHERKRKAEEDAEAEELAKVKAQWDKNYEETRTNRVNSWRTWKTGGKKSKKGGVRPPKTRAEQRD
ncbi:dnaJ homolog subfamily C member 8 [Lingula anatina]|uniref:DnaJ homolog subfamily C member 8 n=1 Tax=Lingula anatina TaxID=7574 RepID=A0A1S3JCX3_LINAN|nr:dnaJ homolog subfamily C member 8 [Lingula anatina]|eukprot:XP_013408031.1 dnaJ homolog subfamily C member 8 [Lingula anatina]